MALMKMPTDLEKLDLQKLQSLVEELLAKKRPQRIEVATVAAEVIRRLGTAKDAAEIAALSDLNDRLSEWLQNDDYRRLEVSA